MSTDDLDLAGLRKVAEARMGDWPGIHPVDLRPAGNLADQMALLDRVAAAEAKVARVEALADDQSRHLVRWIDDSHLVDVTDLQEALEDAPEPTSAPETAQQASGGVQGREGGEGL